MPSIIVKNRTPTAHAIVVAGGIGVERDYRQHSCNICSQALEALRKAPPGNERKNVYNETISDFAQHVFMVETPNTLTIKNNYYYVHYFKKLCSLFPAEFLVADAFPRVVDAYNRLAQKKSGHMQIVNSFVCCVLGRINVEKVDGKSGISNDPTAKLFKFVCNTIMDIHKNLWDTNDLKSFRKTIAYHMHSIQTNKAKTIYKDVGDQLWRGFSNSPFLTPELYNKAVHMSRRGKRTNKPKTVRMEGAQHDGTAMTNINRSIAKNNLITIRDDGTDKINIVDIRNDGTCVVTTKRYGQVLVIPH